MKVWRKPLDCVEKTSAPARIHIDRERCKGCAYCVDFCPREVIKMSSELSPKGYKLPTVEDEDKCLDCGFCEAICPEFAIKITTAVSNSGK
ncbi:ferredoxin family protein [Chloroflexota bacterium]